MSVTNVESLLTDHQERMVTSAEDMALFGELAYEEVDDALNGVVLLEVDDDHRLQVTTVIPEMYAEGAVKQTDLDQLYSEWD